MREVAAAIIYQAGKILIGRRGKGGSCAFLWEFPGGKREPGESLEQCLERECREELDVQVSVGALFGERLHQYPDGAIRLAFYWVRLTQGEPKRIVHQEIRWVTPEELGEFAFCPADAEIIARLQAGEIPEV